MHKISLTNNGDKAMENLMHIFKIILSTLLLASIMSCAATTKQESTGQYIDDSAITAKVKGGFLAVSSG